MTIVVAGGGTGGHLFPGLAVAAVLAQRGHRVRFVGTAAGIEVRAVPAAGFPLDLLPGSQARGGGIGRVARGIGAALAGVRAARGLIRATPPQVVLGVGGYASVSMVLAARLSRIPVVILEQNAIPGAANRLLGRLAACVCLGFAEASPWFRHGRTLHTGNPVRAEVLEAAARAPGLGRGLLVFGGSQGAHRLNVAAAEAIPPLVARGLIDGVTHQTGAADRELVAARYRAQGVAVRVEAFVDDMGAAYADAGLVVARAGAMSCAEITVMGRPAILVPYPHAADDHQRANARALEQAGAASLLDDAACTGPQLGECLTALLAAPDRCRTMAANARRLGLPDAANRVADACEASRDTRAT